MSLPLSSRPRGFSFTPISRLGVTLITLDLQCVLAVFFLLLFLQLFPVYSAIASSEPSALYISAGTAREPDPEYAIFSEKQRLRSPLSQEAERCFMNGTSLDSAHQGMNLKIISLMEDKEPLLEPKTDVSANWGIELDDHSFWEIAPQDEEKLFSWYPQDAILIIPVLSWKYPYDYRLLNQTNGSFVHANLKKVPRKLNKKCHKVIGLDLSLGLIYLDDHSCLRINPEDSLMTKQWELNDRILIGGNTSEDWLEFPNLLINVRRMDDVRAQEIRR